MTPTLTSLPRRPFQRGNFVADQGKQHAVFVRTKGRMVEAGVPDRRQHGPERSILRQRRPLPQRVQHVVSRIDDGGDAALRLSGEVQPLGRVQKFR